MQRSLMSKICKLPHWQLSMSMKKLLKICLFPDKLKIGLSFTSWEVWESLTFQCQLLNLAQPKCRKTMEEGCSKCLLPTLQEQFTLHGRLSLHFWIQSRFKKSKSQKTTLKNLCLKTSILLKFSKNLVENNQTEPNIGNLYDNLGLSRFQRQFMMNLD